MLKFALLFLLSSPLAMAAGTKFTCTGKHNTQKVFQHTVEVKEGEKNKVFADFNEFTFYMSSLGGENYELQVLNHNEPSRSYATGVINADHSYLDLAIWNRSFLLEVRCSL